MAPTLKTGHRRGPTATFLLLAAVFLISCGGGGDSPPLVAMPPADPVILAAQQARLSATYRPDSQQVRLSWTDPFEDEAGFRIERLTGSDWTAVDTLPASQGRGTVMSWALPASTDATYRVLALLSTTTATLRTVTLESQVQVQAQTALPSWVMANSEPFQGTVSFSINGTPPGATVRYFADFAALGATLQTPPFAQSWDTNNPTNRVSNGSHLLQALVQLTPDTALELRRQVTVSNASAPVQKVTLSTVGARTTVAIEATSPVGVASVELFVDGVSAGLLTAPNVCASGSCSTSGPRLPPQWTYNFTLLHSSYTNGTHTLRVESVDNNGVRSLATTTVEMNAAPQIDWASPVDGHIAANGSLSLSGTVSDDTPEAVVSVMLGALEIRRLNGGAFGFSYDLAGVPSGVYDVSIKAQDRQGLSTTIHRDLWVQAGPALPSEFVGTLGGGSLVRGADSNTVLVKWSTGGSTTPNAPDKRTRLVSGSAATGVTTVALDPMEFKNDTNFWRYTQGRTFSFGVGTDTGGSYNVYMWEADGRRRNLSKETGVTDAFQERPTPDGDWVVWYGGPSSSRLVLYNPTSGLLHSIRPPAGAGSLGNNEYALASRSPTRAEVYYWVNEGTGYGVYHFDSASGLTQRLSPSGSRDTYIKTDGTRVAWQRLKPGSIDSPFDLVVASASQPTQLRVLSTSMTRWFLDDGLLVWQEVGPTSSVIKVDDGTTSFQLSNRLSATVLDVSGGTIAYAEDGKLWVWSAAKGSRLVMDNLPGNVRLGGQTLYFTTGQTCALYRVAL